MEAREVRAYERTTGTVLPEALRRLYLDWGAGSLGGFLDLASPRAIVTHRELVGPLLEPEDEPLIAPTAEVRVFGRTVNGDLVGWAEGVDELDRVVRLAGFDQLPLEPTTAAFLDALTHADLFGVGPLDGGYRAGRPAG